MTLKKKRSGKSKLDVVKIYQKLLKQMGRQGWWPLKIINHKSEIINGRNEYSLTYGIPYAKLDEFKTYFRNPYFEIAVGAILTQNTAWRNVALAIVNLYGTKALTPQRLLSLPIRKLQQLIRPAGYYRQKAKKLRLLAEWLTNNYHGDITKLKNCSLFLARCSLLDRWGIGRETADSILLYALNKPIFVVDEYTRRLCRQYGVEFKEYDEYREFFEKQLRKRFTDPRKLVEVYREFHALIVNLLKHG